MLDAIADIRLELTERGGAFVPPSFEEKPGRDH